MPWRIWASLRKFFRSNYRRSSFGTDNIGLVNPGGRLAQVLGNIENGIAVSGQPTSAVGAAAIVSDAATAAGLDAGFVVSVGADGSIVLSNSGSPHFCFREAKQFRHSSRNPVSEINHALS